MTTEEWINDQDVISRSKRMYAHFDYRTDLGKAKKYVTDPEKVAQHGFYPFIHYTKEFKKYSKNDAFASFFIQPLQQPQFPSTWALMYLSNQNKYPKRHWLLFPVLFHLNALMPFPDIFPYSLLIWLNEQHHHKQKQSPSIQ